MSGADKSVRGIDCTEAMRKLWEYLDGELTPERAKEVQVHLQVCAHCFQIAKLERIFLDGIAATRLDVTVPDDLRERITAALVRAGFRRE